MRACRVPDECAGQTVCHEQLTAVKNADELKQWERNIDGNIVTSMKMKQLVLHYFILAR